LQNKIEIKKLNPDKLLKGQEVRERVKNWELKDHFPIKNVQFRSWNFIFQIARIQFVNEHTLL